MAAAKAVATAQIVPSGVAADIATLESDIEDETGVTSEVDPGNDLIVSVDAEAEDTGTAATSTLALGGADGGSYALVVNGIEAAAGIGYDADNAAIKAHLETIPIVNEVTVTGTTTKTIVFNDPVRPTTLAMGTEDLTNETVAINSTVTGVKPVSATAYAKITDAVAAVGDCVILSSTTANVPAVAVSSATPSVAEDGTATVTVTTTLDGSDTCSLSLVGVPSAIEDYVTLVDHGDTATHAAAARIAEGRQGEGTITIDPASNDVDGTYKFAVMATDGSGRTDYVIVTLTITNPA